MDRRFWIWFSILTGISISGVVVSARADGTGVTEIAVRDVLNVLEDKRWVLVDTRATDAFNGWKLDGVSRGGHLPGAVDFPASWLDSERPDRKAILTSALRAKRIQPGRHVVLYGSNRDARRRVANYLREAGYPHLYEFDIEHWASDPTKPLVRYENFHLLVPPVVVKQLLDGQRPETFAHAKRVKFVEVSWGGEDVSYEKGHVPRSFHVNTDHFEPPPSWKLGGPEVLRGFARQYGFHVDDTIILSGADPTASYRLAIVLRYMGVRDVRVLNGGFGAWKAANYPIETTRTLPPRVDSFGEPIPARPDMIEDITRVKAGLHRPDEFALVDTRSWAEFVGETSGYSYHSRRGRIPGAVFGQGDYKGRNSLAPYRNIDQTMRNADEIRMLWKQAGIDVRRHLSFMCGGGWRAAEVLTFAEVMGLSDIALFSDGWIGWSNDSRNPTDTGPVRQRVDAQRE